MGKYQRRETLNIQVDSLGEKYRFELENGECKPIGEGGSGIVYKADQVFCDVDSVFAPRAVKFFAFRDDLVAEYGYASNDNFRTEIINITKFNHQNILKVVDGDYYTVYINEQEVKIPYTVTEYVDGYTLETVFEEDESILKDVFPNEERIFDLFFQIASGLSYLHSNAFFHCDIAPKNVFLKKNVDSEWFAIIGDLGAGRTVLPNSFEKTRVIGTWNYMTSEAQAVKNHIIGWDEFSKLQPHWDIYSLVKTITETIERIKNKNFLVEVWHLDRLYERLTTCNYRSVSELAEDIEALRPNSNRIFQLDELSEASNQIRQILIPINPAFMSNRMYALAKHDLLLRLMNVPELLEGATTFPSANHTRYEHSLGTYELMRKAMLSLLRNKKYVCFFDKRMVILGLLSALLSSLTNYPLSYALTELSSHEKQLMPGYSNRILFEKLLSYKKNESEESLLECIKKNFADYSIQLNELEYVMFGKNSDEERNEKLEVLFNLLNSSVGVRIIDYLARDSYHIGLKYSIDTDSLFSHMSIHNGEFCLNQVGISAAEQVIINRYWLFKRVYWCEPNRANAALLKLLFFNTGSEEFVKELLDAIPKADRSDIERLILENTREKERARAILDFLRQKGKKRYRRVIVIGKNYTIENAGRIWDRFIIKSYTEQEKVRARIETKVIEYLGIPREAIPALPVVLIDIPFDKRGNKLGNDIKIVKHDGREDYLSDISTTIKGINDSFNEQLTLLRVYIHPDIYAEYLSKTDATKKCIDDLEKYISKLLNNIL